MCSNSSYDVRKDSLMQMALDAPPFTFSEQDYNTFLHNSWGNSSGKLSNWIYDGYPTSKYMSPVGVNKKNLTVKVKVPEKVVGLVVGPKGATIKRIQKVTSTFIITPSRNSEPIFTITGKEEDVNEAKEQIKNHIIHRTGNLVESKNLPLSGSCNFNNDQKEYLVLETDLSEDSDRRNDDSDGESFQMSKKVESIGSLKHQDSGVGFDFLPINYPDFNDKENEDDLTNEMNLQFDLENINLSKCEEVTTNPFTTSFSFYDIDHKINVEQLLTALEKKMKQDGKFIENGMKSQHLVMKETRCLMCFKQDDYPNYMLKCHHRLCLQCTKGVLTKFTHCPICHTEILREKC